MRKRILFVVLILSPLFLFCQTTDSGLHYELSTDTTTYFYSDTIHWEMSITNKSDDTLTLDGINEDTFFSWALKNADGKSFNEFGVKDSTYTRDLVPGDSLAMQWITDLPIMHLDTIIYSTTLPGKYIGIARPLISSEEFLFDTTTFRITGGHPALDFSISTEKRFVESGDTVDIRITGENTTKDSVILHWNDGCQVSYWVNERYNGQTCVQIPTEIAIDGFSSYTWTLRRSPGSDPELKPGIHHLTGEIISYGITDTITFVIADKDFSYFPMEVGYFWTLASSYDTLTESITEKAAVKNHQYYRFDRFGDSTDVLMRYEDHKVYRYQDSIDVLWYDFTAAPGDTWHIPVPESDAYSVMKLVSIDDTVSTYGKTFTDCYRFFHSYGLNNEYSEWYAPNTGLVRREIYAFAINQWNLLDFYVGTQPFGPEPIPGSIKLFSIYPNPFNLRTTITYSLPRSVRTSIRVHDITGRKVRTLVDSKMKSSGKHVFTWNATGLPSGVYFITVSTPSEQVNQKAVLLK